MTSFASRFLMAEGQGAIIDGRSPAVSTFVSMKRATKTVRDLGARDAYWDGLIPLSCSLVSGDVIVTTDNRYLTQTAETDPASGETHFFATKVNCSITHQRQTETVSAGNIVKVWANQNVSADAFGEVITAALRQYDPGLLPGTKYLFQLKKALDVEMLDRIVFDASNYQVDSVDDLVLGGVVRLQCSSDTRP